MKRIQEKITADGIAYVGGYRTTSSAQVLKCFQRSTVQLESRGPGVYKFKYIKAPRDLWQEKNNNAC